MTFYELYTELTGHIPKLDVDLAKKFIQRSFLDIQRKNLWSFQLFDANWTSPGIVNGGTVTTTQGLNTVTFDATASPLIAALGLLGPFPTPLIQRQFRIGIGTIYNIWAFDQGVTGLVTLTLDRPYAESSATGSSYQVYQCYYPSSYKDHYCWINVRDIINYNDLDVFTTRTEIDNRDPQRSIFYLPTKVVFYRNEPNTQSPNYRWPVWELWGQPQYQLTYQLSGIRRILFENDEDELPVALGDDVVIANAKVKAYEWAEANKGDMPRNAGSDFKFLMGAANAEYVNLYRGYRKDDRELVDNFFRIRRHRSWLSNIDGFYNSIGNTASAGAPW